MLKYILLSTIFLFFSLITNCMEKKEELELTPLEIKDHIAQLDGTYASTFYNPFTTEVGIKFCDKSERVVKILSLPCSAIDKFSSTTLIKPLGFTSCNENSLVPCILNKNKDLAGILINFNVITMLGNCISIESYDQIIDITFAYHEKDLFIKLLNTTQGGYYTKLIKCNLFNLRPDKEYDKIVTKYMPLNTLR